MSVSIRQLNKIRRVNADGVIEDEKRDYGRRLWLCKNQRSAKK